MQKWERNREPPPPYGVSAKRNAYIDDDARFMEKRQQVSMDGTHTLIAYLLSTAAMAYVLHDPRPDAAEASTK